MTTEREYVKRRRNVCAIDGCERLVMGRGLCQMHYMQHLRAGTLDGFSPRVVRTCSVGECEKRVHGHELCLMHYKRWRNNGDPLIVSRGHPVKRPAAERFWEKVEIPTACWLWTASTDSSGYGTFRDDSWTTVSAHRFAYETLVGPIPEGLELDHLCRVRNCVNPDHLEPVTKAENQRRGILARSDMTEVV